ncbi:uncharacterized protein UHO2_04888 [Ustilago hordei]|uniref:Uncharacterized protein n=1 Tax=Ustilago hordei TaxID=120017 RepID=I2FU84_USTHO|nr:uncharacterized protein UHO2_04888 [Ustilago hordei]CCF50477.1 uncharacterized protein UHOR_05645 [Ustilago hordei]SYW82971.1 uncharacterized protein UHO2_04888 [Ustilago hordei]
MVKTVGLGTIQSTSLTFRAAVLLLLLSFIAATLAAPIEKERGRDTLVKRSDLLVGDRAEKMVFKRNPYPEPNPIPAPEPAAKIVKHVKALCEGPICNHAAFYG